MRKYIRNSNPTENDLLKRKIAREWYWNNKDQARASQRRYKYKIRYGVVITTSIYNDLLVKQNGCCAICGKKEQNCTRKLSIDHDHKTKKIRGLLCSNCNRGIGHLMDDVILLQKAIDYLNSM